MTTLFSDDFSSGNLSKWSRVVGTPTIVADTVHGAGTYALSCPANYSYVVKNGLLSTPFHTQFYFRLSALPPVGKGVIVARGVDATGNLLIWDVYIWNNGGTYTISLLWYYPSYGEIDYPISLVANTRNCVEVRFVSSATSGEYHLWVNNLDAGSQTGLNTSSCGAQSQISIGEDDTGYTTNVWIDDVIAANAYIGTGGVPTTGTISVTATSGGSAVAASVSVSGQTGTTPWTSAALSPSTYSVSATYGGTTLTQNATVIAGQNTAITFVFPTTGTITVSAVADSTTVAAAVTADGSSGTTPVVFTFPSGTYTLTATYQGQTLPSQTVTVAAGQNIPVVFHFAATISLTVVAGANGTVSPSGALALAIGQTYTFTATPNANYKLDHWDLSGTNLGASNPYSLTVTSSMNGQTLTALFVANTITLNVSASANGSVSPSGPQTLTIGQTYSFTASPNTNYQLDHWSLAGTSVGASNPYILTASSALNGQSLTAIFTAITITVTVSAGANGTVSPSGTQILTLGQTYSFAAIPNTNYQLDHWTLNGVSIGSSNPLQLTATASMQGNNLIALFTSVPPVQVTMALAVNPANAGTTTPAVGPHQFNVGTAIQFTAAPVAGWDFVQWQLDSTAYSNNPLSLPIISSMNGQTLTAIFTPSKISLSVATTAGGTVNPTGTQVLTVGQSYSYTANPSVGCVLDHWELGGINVGSTNPYVLTATLDMNGKTLLAVFVAAKITLTVTATAYGSVSPVGTQTLTVGTQYSFGAIPNTGYQLDHWDLGGANIGSTNPLQLTASLDMNGKTLTAIFTLVVSPQVTIILAVDPSNGGSVGVPIGPNKFNVGDMIQFTATPSGDYVFVQWTLDGVTTTNNPFLLSIASNMDGKTLTAQFTIPQITLNVVAAPNGTVNPSGMQTLIVGHSYQFAAIGNSGYVLDHWELGTQDLGSANPLTLTPTQSNDGQTLMATFKQGVAPAGFPWGIVLAVGIPLGVTVLASLL